MHPLLLCLVASNVVLRLPGSVQDDAARALIERAIVAQGGSQRVAKLHCMRIKVEGTMNFVPGQPNLPFTIEDIWQMPDRYKTTSTISIAGQKHVQTEVIDGDKGWSRVDGAVQ